MKKVLAIGFVFVFLPLILVGPVFLLQKELWKEKIVAEMKQNLKEFEAVELFFTNDEFNTLSWCDGKKEFVLDASYYDVIEIKSVNNGKIIKCINDKGEERLVEQFIHTGKGKPNPFHQLIKVMWTKILFEENTQAEWNRRDLISPKQVHRFYYAFSIQESGSTLLSPPPIPFN